MSITSSDLYDASFSLQSSGSRSRRGMNQIHSNRDEILNTVITNFFVNIEPMGPKVFQVGRCIFNITTQVLPAKISPAGASHASLYVPMSDKEGVWIEYGAYDDKRSGDFKGQVHYFQGTNGLRFAKMTRKEYFEKMDKAGILSKMIECRARHQMTIKHLFESISSNNWSKHKYSLGTHNCQRFVVYSLQILGAYRTKIGIHCQDKVTIPFGILECLEKNELDSNLENIRIIEKIPCIGPLVDFGMQIAALID